MINITDLVINLALAQSPEAVTEATTTVASGDVKTGAEKGGGIEIQPSTVFFQVLNFLVLMVILNFLIFKPLLKMLKQREEKIREGIENAQKADFMIKESHEVKADMLKTAKAEGQNILADAKKSAEGVRSDILEKANVEADKIVAAGELAAENEKAKAAKQLQGKMAELVVQAAEKILQEKLDAKKDAQLIEESIKSVSF